VSNSQASGISPSTYRSETVLIVLIGFAQKINTSEFDSMLSSWSSSRGEEAKAALADLNPLWYLDTFISLGGSIT
jgi:hypothetical protein